MPGRMSLMLPGRQRRCSGNMSRMLLCLYTVHRCALISVCQDYSVHHHQYIINNAPAIYKTVTGTSAAVACFTCKMKGKMKPIRLKDAFSLLISSWKGRFC